MGLARQLIGIAAVSLTLVHTLPGCSSSQDHPPNIDTHTNGGSTSTGGGGQTSNPDASAGGTSSVQNCGDTLACNGHTHCLVTSNGASCACDTGYVRLDSNGVKVDDTHQDIPCTVDTTCVRLRFLENDSCRYETNGAPAVGLFFAVDYCSGTAVLDIADPTTAFQISEDGAAVTSSSVETSATIIEGRDIESYLALVIDVSGDLTNQNVPVPGGQPVDLVASLVKGLRGVITGLTPAPGKAPVGISILLFGRFVQEYLPFTSNLDDVNAALQRIQDDPKGATKLVSTNGTSIHEAVERGIHSVERMQALRHVVSNDGLLTSGTVVVVTDGTDNSGGYPIPADLIKNTKVNVITVGISSKIDDTDLTALGRDGSFLAPTVDDFDDTFTEIATRIRNYPKRAYLLGYCSPATVGVHAVSVTLKDQSTRKVQEKATCSFDADLFGSDPSQVCDPNYFKHGCDNQECGGLAACGACPDDQCCAGGSCQGPGAVATDCRNEDELCSASGLICLPIPNSQPPKFKCDVGVELGQPCGDNAPCRPSAYCKVPQGAAMGVCVARYLATLNPLTGAFEAPPDAGLDGAALTDVCGDSISHPAAACPELNCAQQKAQNANEDFICLPQARVFDRCGGPTASAVCEPGSACQKDPSPTASTTDPNIYCQPRHVLGCQSDLDCASGHCNAIMLPDGTKSGTCFGSGACYFSWSSKMNR